MPKSTLQPPEVVVRALLQVTAKAWCLPDQGSGVQPATAPLPHAADRDVGIAVRSAVKSAAALPPELVPHNWPYWPAYPGLAAGWR